MHPEDRVLDWQGRWDEESKNFLVRKASPTLKLRNWSWRRNLWLDQGSEGACTGFGLGHVLGTTPRRMGQITNDYARQRYYRARQEDEWDGENYEGSSVLGAMKAAHKDGIIKSYFWAMSLEEILHAICYLGPVEAGTWWYSGMDHPQGGIVKATGWRRGGHAYQLGGVNLAQELVRIDNSWGKEGWGAMGSAWISFDDLDRLRREQGEFAVARKFKITL